MRVRAFFVEKFAKTRFGVYLCIVKAPVRKIGDVWQTMPAAFIEIENQNRRIHGNQDYGLIDFALYQRAE